MKLHHKNLSYLLVFSESLNDIASIKRCMEYHRKYVGFWPTYHSQILIVLPHFPPCSLCINSILTLAECYEKQAQALTEYLHSEYGFAYEQIHIESGSLEKLIRKYVHQYSSDETILDFKLYRENDFLYSGFSTEMNPIKKKLLEFIQ